MHDDELHCSGATTLFSGTHKVAQGEKDGLINDNGLNFNHFGVGESGGAAVQSRIYNGIWRTQAYPLFFSHSSHFRHQGQPFCIPPELHLKMH